MSLIYDQPCSPGVANALERVRHMVEFRWTPVMEMTLNPRPNSNGFLSSARNGRAAQNPAPLGIPYSSSRILDRFVGFDISFDTFRSAVENPASIVYRRDLSDFDDEVFHPLIGNVFFPYGTVCSAFASYVLDLPVHRCTHEWDCSPDFFEVTPRQVDRLQLLDCLLDHRPGNRTGKHVRLVTGIGRDAYGRVRTVEISEGVTPSPCSRWYPAEEIAHDLTPQGKGQRIFRYRHVGSIRPPAPLMSLSQELMLDLGAYSNYPQGERVQFNINCPADTLVIESDDTMLEIPVTDIAPTIIQGNPYTIVSKSDLAPGRYRAYCKMGERRTRPSVCFNVFKTPDIQLTDAAGNPFPRIALKPVDPEGRPLQPDSPCLYTPEGELSAGPITIALSDGQQLIPAQAAVRARNGEPVIRLAATLTDEAGKRVLSFRVGEDVTLYALAIHEYDVVRARFGGSEACAPLYYSCTEEAVIAYDQRLLTTTELIEGEVALIARRHGNDFFNFMIFCENEFGRVSTEPITFVFLN